MRNVAPEDLEAQVTCATPRTLLEIANDCHRGVGMCFDYENWWQDHYCGRRPSGVQVGDWIYPIQGDCDVERQTLVMAMHDMGLGDGGVVYLRSSPERGFFTCVHTH